MAVALAANCYQKLHRRFDVTNPVQGILNHAGVLKPLLEMQRLDEWDVEGVQPLCEHALFHLQQQGATRGPSALLSYQCEL